MTPVMQIGETARDRTNFCRCFKTGAAVFLHDDGIVAHATYRNTLRAAYILARTNCDTRGCKPFGIRMRCCARPTCNQHHHSQRKPLAKPPSEKRPTPNVQRTRNSLSQWPTHATAGANLRK